MNTSLMFSSKTDMWATPQSFFDAVNARFKFTLDVCATIENTKCDNFFSPEDDGLSKEWTGTCWMNPPYGREIKKWVKKAYDSAKSGRCTVVALLPARTDTKWFHECVYMKDGVSIEFLEKRLKFGNSSNSAPFPSMLVIFKKNTPPS